MCLCTCDRLAWVGVGVGVGWSVLGEGGQLVTRRHSGGGVAGRGLARSTYCNSWVLRPHHTKLVLTTFWKMLPKRAQTVCERSEGSSNCLRSV